MMTHFYALVASILIGLPASAATVDIVATQDGEDVVFTGSGSVDLTGSDFEFTFDATNINQSNFRFFIGADDGLSDVYSWDYGWGGQSLSWTGFDLEASGDTFGFDRLGAFGLNAGYNSGDEINFAWTVFGASFADLSLNFGTLAELGNNTVSLSAAPSVVPLPASSLLLLAGLGGFAAVSRKKRKA
ncbi:VPLPA-CTERM sorting domain-containing protein [Rhodobacteraceae bacterium]|nr:VPLPA-CTERM sorting domain-containing protein [Paracoccaceae bacterium]